MTWHVEFARPWTRPNHPMLEDGRVVGFFKETAISARSRRKPFAFDATPWSDGPTTASLSHLLDPPATMAPLPFLLPPLLFLFPQQNTIYKENKAHPFPVFLSFSLFLSLALQMHVESIFTVKRIRFYIRRIRQYRSSSRHTWKGSNTRKRRNKFPSTFFAKHS